MVLLIQSDVLRYVNSFEDMGAVCIGDVFCRGPIQGNTITIFYEDARAVFFIVKG